MGVVVQVDESISSKVSLALSKLKDDGVVEDIAYGYWQKC